MMYSDVSTAGPEYGSKHGFRLPETAIVSLGQIDRLIELAGGQTGPAICETLSPIEG